MANRLENWEGSLEKELECIEVAERQKAGALLRVIPSHADWDCFLATVKEEWSIWRRDLTRYPNCLIVLYGGLAFYEYDENRFWPQFAEAVGDQFPANRQGETNRAFAKAAENLGLKIRRRDSGTDYIGSAIYYIGIPLSLWDGFLEICEWALWQDDWKGLSDVEWAVTKRAGSRTRLRNFLRDNREAASAFIQEMHDAREILIEDELLAISDLKQACILRQEYFDEVPETAEFLRPANPESLFRDRARLVWDEQRYRINLHLPAVSNNKLPATWTVGTRTQTAAAAPDILTLNSEAFTHSLLLSLQSGQQSETQWLRGVAPWGLFDPEKTRFVNPERQQLPIGSYLLVSPDKLDIISRDGFDEDENPANEPYELEDGKVCYITRLWPTRKAAELSLAYAGVVKKLLFRSNLKIEARIFAGEGSYAANFSRYKDCTKVERLPLLCVAIPFGSFQNTESVMQRKLQVTVDEHPTDGVWEKRHEDEDREFYFWRWANESPLHGKVVIAIKAPELGMKFEYQVEMLRETGMDECWKNLPGAFLPWILLAQPTAGTREGMRWNDLMLGKEAIAPEHPGFSEYLLRKYTNHGLLTLRGRTWMIAESRAVLKTTAGGECLLEFCGNPTVLWGLFKHMRSHTHGAPLPSIEVVNKRGELPFLLIRWQASQEERVRRYMQNHNVRIVSDLWRI